MASVPDVKLVILGDSGVGKSSLIYRFLHDDFLPFSESTIGASYMSKVVGGVNFKVWDTAGQEKYRSLSRMYYRGAAAAILVYDLTNPESFKGMQRWFEDLSSNVSLTSSTGERSMVLAICGNKEDLISNDNRKIDEESARQYAIDIGAFYFETSAKEDVNVNQLFMEIAKEITILKSSSIAEDVMSEEPLVNVHNANFSENRNSSCC